MSEVSTIWDPLRKKEVALTPEERVRQWFISVLANDMKVPAHMMMSEVPLCLGDKQWRADILVYDREQKPLMIVECKRPDVTLDQQVLEQAIRYNMVLDVKCIVITNGPSTYLAYKKDGKLQFAQNVLTYEELLKL